jgi:hypothetical protein
MNTLLKALKLHAGSELEIILIKKTYSVGDKRRVEKSHVETRMEKC